LDLKNQVKEKAALTTKPTLNVSLIQITDNNTEHIGSKSNMNLWDNSVAAIFFLKKTFWLETISFWKLVKYIELPNYIGWQLTTTSIE